jgi:hypothetical protein
MAGGRPPMFKTAKDMQKVIDTYFDSCKGEVLKDADGETVFNKYGMPVIVNSKPLTVTGLALALGFNSRQALLNYNERPEFNDTVTRAKAMVEEYAESRLFDKDGANGAKFSLANNFKGWVEKVDSTIKSENTNINIDADMDAFRRKATADEIANGDKLSWAEIQEIMRR